MDTFRAKSLAGKLSPSGPQRSALLSTARGRAEWAERKAVGRRGVGLVHRVWTAGVWTKKVGSGLWTERGNPGEEDGESGG